MALTYTPEISTKALMPQFSTTALDGQIINTADFSPKVRWIMFICNHCPYVKAIEDRLITTAKKLQDKGVEVIAICSNDPTDHPEDSPEQLLKQAQDKSYPFVYIFDHSQSIAKDFGAVCTPDFFVYNEDNELIYRGRLDDSWKNPKLVETEELVEAVEKWLNSKEIIRNQTPSMGCSIKWN